MSIIEQIKAEVERHKELFKEAAEVGNYYAGARLDEANEILSFLDTLQEQPVCEELEEAAQHDAICTYTMPEDGDIEKVFKVQEARVFHEIGFKAGANWQKQQDSLHILETCKENGDSFTSEALEEAAKEYVDDTNPADSFYDAFKDGALWMREQMLKEAVEGRVVDAGIFATYNTPVEYTHPGDKVKIIIVKED